MTPIVGLGAGGHARVVIEILRLMGDFELIGLLDPKPELKDTDVLKVPVLGDDNLLPDLYRQGVLHIFLGLGSTGDTQPRRNLYEHALAQGFLPVQAIHPRSIISPSAVLGEGLTVMAGAIINAEARLGHNVIVNSGAIIEHDCEIGNHVHIATGAQLASTVRIGEGAHIGAGATVRQSISIGNNAIVGAGAAVVNDVDTETVVVGVPARILKIER